MDTNPPNLTRTAGDTGPFMRNSVTNRADFSQLFERWAKISVEAMAELKAMSPIPENPKAARCPASSSASSARPVSKVHACPPSTACAWIGRMGGDLCARPTRRRCW